MNEQVTSITRAPTAAAVYVQYCGLLEIVQVTASMRARSPVLALSVRAFHEDVPAAAAGSVYRCNWY